jgi:ankyrin repeat protein
MSVTRAVKIRSCLALRQASSPKFRLLPLQSGHTPLLIASENGHIEAVDRLVEARAEVNARSNVGEPASWSRNAPPFAAYTFLFPFPFIFAQTPHYPIP